MELTKKKDLLEGNPFKVILSFSLFFILGDFLQQVYNVVDSAIVGRFVSTNAIKNNLRSIKQGTTDIIIGTHRILSKDVEFKDLGLLIIDEEQRFGVEAKEKIKEIKQNVDVLTLTATPIPRTLQMAIAGIKDVSLIETPANP